ncbi:MAG: hypothetical protein AseanaTS_11220 [Candidatus Pelagadaptatus aseana]|uniref:TIGR02444 family protein n=1 Tax=Candidatus Pelagadaptatus aseana TaxID=3120508 RepID=UPI0039B2CC98
MPDLWEFALATYARPGVESHCLTLQDGEGINVNVLLWSMWLDHCERGVDEDFWRHAVAEIQDHHRRVKRVRTLRRRMPKVVGLRWLRNKIKSRELSLEQRELLELQCLTEQRELPERAFKAAADGYLRLSLMTTSDPEGWAQKLLPD